MIYICISQREKKKRLNVSLCFLLLLTAFVLSALFQYSLPTFCVNQKNDNFSQRMSSFNYITICEWFKVFLKVGHFWWSCFFYLIAKMMSCLLGFVCLPASCLPVCCPNYMHLPTQQPTKRGQHVYVSFSAHQKNKQSHLFFQHCESGLALLCCFFTLSKKNETLHLPLFLTTSVFSNKDFFDSAQTPPPFRQKMVKKTTSFFLYKTPIFGQIMPKNLIKPF